MMDRARKSLQVGLLLPYIQGLMDRAEATSAVHLHISRVTQGAKLANALALTRGVVHLRVESLETLRGADGCSALLSRIP
jgi:hypothetical protein